MVLWTNFLKADEMTRPNILLMIADDHRFSAIHSLGIETAATPALDRLMAEGTAFTQAHIMGSTSGAVCMPSRGMLMTGRSLFATPDPLPADSPLLPELLWQHGYTTFSAGKWHNRRESFARGFSASGRTFFGGMSDQYAVPVHDFDPAGVYDPQTAYIPEGFSTTLFTDDIIDFLNAHQPGDDPFFAYVAYTSPHDPRTPPPPYDRMYPPHEIELPPNFMAEHPFDLGVGDIRDEMLAGYPRTEAEVRRHTADYYGMISHMDAEIGRILQTLDDKNLRGDTIVIYTSDHGLGVGQHGLMGKQNLYDHSMRIPLIMRGPGIPAGRQSEALVYLFDLFPTLCQRAGLPLPASNEGHSLNGLLNGQTDQRRRSIFSAYQGVFGHPQGRPCQRSVKDERHKLIQSILNDEVTWQLFDLQADPWETENLVGEQGCHDVFQRLRRSLRGWQERVNDPLLQNDR